MNKTLVLLGIVCLATVAMAQVTMDFTPTADTGMDGSGVHHTRGVDTQIRVGKGSMNSGEMGVYSFDTTAIQNFINANLGGKTLTQAIDAGMITVNFSVVCSAVATGNEAHQVGLMDVFTNSTWFEGPGPASTGPGDDNAYNWTGSGIAMDGGTTPAATMESPNDYLGQTNGWFDTKNGWGHQEFKNMPGTANSNVLSNWATNARNSVVLDDNLWAEYIYGVNSSTGAPSLYATNCLKTYGMDSFDPSETDPNVCIYTKEDNAADHAPRLTVTIAGTVTPPKYIHAHPGDANNDGKCDVVDLGVLAKYYDSTGLPTSAVDPFGAGSWQKADFNNDGKVDVVDLGALAKNYDWVGTPAVPTPEPMTLSLLAAGGLALIRRRK